MDMDPFKKKARPKKPVPQANANAKATVKKESSFEEDD
jgi:hypothetical protein